MSTAEIITDELIRSLAPNTSAVSNGQKISRNGGFVSLSRSSDNTLIFGECKGSGSKPYYTSADFSGDTPVFRCSCPSRQFPCKHSLAIMFDWLAKKEFKVSEIPEDIIRKREKIAKKTEKSDSDETNPTVIEKKKKASKTAVTKKLKKQLEGLELAEQFVNDILNRGVSSVNSSSAMQYKNLAKQLGDYYLPEPQAIMNEIITIAEKLSSNSDDNEINCLVSLCIKLSSTVKKSREYITSKIESGEVFPEDNILYEAMGNVWKLTQLKEIGLYKENSCIVQLSFTVIDDNIHKALVDSAYWIDLDTGEISKTENIRPLKALKYVKEEDSSFGVHIVPVLYKYPGGLNRRIRWENSEIVSSKQQDYERILSLAEKSIGDAVKKAKNELKNTLSDSAVAFLIPFDSIGFSDDGHSVLKYGSETIALKSNKVYSDTCTVLSVLGKNMLTNGALLGELFYNPVERKIYCCPISIVNSDGIIRLC